MNVAAGIVIGWVSSAWISTFIAAALWGVGFCAWQGLAARLGVGQARFYSGAAHERFSGNRVRAAFAFYMPAYVSAVVTAFGVAAVFRLVRWASL